MYLGILSSLIVIYLCSYKSSFIIPRYSNGQMKDLLISILLTVNSMHGLSKAAPQQPKNPMMRIITPSVMAT